MVGVCHGLVAIRGSAGFLIQTVELVKSASLLRSHLEVGLEAWISVVRFSYGVNDNLTRSTCYA